MFNLLKHFILLKLFPMLTLLALFISFVPENASAVSPDISRMKKRSLLGNITLSYEDRNTKSGSSTSKTSRFMQNYRLNYMGYVVSPKFMHYNLNGGWDIDSGNNNRAITKTYGINMSFFPMKRYNFSIRASKSDGKDYESSNYGMTFSYLRPKRAKPKEARPALRNTNDNSNSNSNSNSNANANSNANTNVNINSNNNNNNNNNININDEEEVDDITNDNAAAKKVIAKPKKTGIFSSLFNAMPTSTFFNADRISNKRAASETKWDNADLRLMGDFSETSYNLNFNYNNWNTGGSRSHKGYGADWTSRTRLHWKFFERLENAAHYRKNGTQSYSLGSYLLSPQGKALSYGLSGNYSNNDSGQGQYSVSAFASKNQNYKGVNLTYGASTGYTKTNYRGDFYGSLNLGASKQLAYNLNLNSTGSITYGSLGTSYAFSAGISHFFQPRKRAATNAGKNSKISRPSGWDYSITSGYSFSYTKDAAGRNSSTGGVTENQGRALMTHRGNLGIRVYFSRGTTLNSDAVLTHYSRGTTNFSWNNSIYTIVMRKIRITLGSTLNIDKPESGTKTTNLTAYGNASYPYSRNVLLNLNTQYTKTNPSGATILEITPSVQWRVGLLFVSLDLTMRDTSENGSKTKERRVLVRVTRPLKIL